MEAIMITIMRFDWVDALKTLSAILPPVSYLLPCWIFFRKTRYIWVIQMAVLEWPKDIYDPYSMQYKYYGALATHILFLFATSMFGFAMTQLAMCIGYSTGLSIFPGMLVMPNSNPMLQGP